MWLKGIVMKVRENYAIVLTDDNEFTKIKLKHNLAVGQKIMFTKDDIFVNQKKRGDITVIHKLVAAAAVFVFLIVGGIMGYNNLFIDQGAQGVLHNVVAIVTVDINPSIQISVNADNKVVEAIALNDDGETLDLTGLIGIDVDEAIESIVTSAREAGFIDVEDLVEDYVLITTIPIDEDNEEEAEEIEAKIEDKICESKELQNVNVAMIDATMTELEEAQQSNTPVGIVAANGGVKLGNQTMSVKEFFANKERVEAFANNGRIIEQTFENKVALLEKYLNEMEAEGVNIESIKASFEMSKKDFFEAKKLFDLAKDEYHQALKSGDKNAIAAAKAVMEDAEKFKDYMEDNKDDLEAINDLVKEHFEDKDDDNDDDDNNGKGNGNKSDEKQIKEQEKEEKKNNKENKNSNKHEETEEDNDDDDDDEDDDQNDNDDEDEDIENDDDNEEKYNGESNDEEIEEDEEDEINGNKKDEKGNEGNNKEKDKDKNKNEDDDESEEDEEEEDEEDDDEEEDDEEEEDDDNEDEEKDNQGNNGNNNGKKTD